MIVAPEVAPWVDMMRAPDEQVYAPWAWPVGLGRWLPGRAGAFVERRARPDQGLPSPLVAIEPTLRLWARRRVDRLLAGRFFQRMVVDRAASTRQLSGGRVVAPSLGAQAIFARARREGLKTVLIEDLPDLRTLQADLDRAAARHPECRFLRRYRAPAELVARQERERVLADEIWVTSTFAEELRLAGGMRADSIHRLQRSTDERPPIGYAPGSSLVLLAGLAAARNGTVEALAALDELPGVTLLVRAGEGMEPADLLERPQVRVYAGEDVAAVVAPAWCETHPSEVARAIAGGVPVVATTRAAGFHENTCIIDPGDVNALIAGLCEVMDETIVPATNGG